MSDLGDKKEEIEKIVLLVKKGDHDAFARLYDIFIDPIYRYVYYRVANGEAEDLVETVFLKVWENIGKYRAGNKNSFSAWIFRIAHNLVIDHYRVARDRDYENLNESLPDHDREHSPLFNTQHKLNNGLLRRAMSKLKINYQEIITYKFINDLSNEEIAQVLGKSEGSLRILQFRALKALKKELEEMGVLNDY